MLTSPGRPYNDIPCMHRLSASTLAAVLLASVAPAAHAQAVTGLGEDAATVGAGRLRLSIGGDWSLAQQSYVPDGQGGHILRPLGAALTVDSLGAAQIAALGPLQDSLRAATGSSALHLSLGRSDTRVSQTITRVPISLEAGLTRWLSLRATLPMVHTISDVFFAANVGGNGANLGANPARSDPSAFASDTALVGQLARSAAAVATYCGGAGAGSSACAGSAAFVTSTQALSAELGSVYAAGGFAPVQSSALQAQVDARIASAKNAIGAFAAIPGSGVSSVSGAVVAASAPVTTADVQSFLTDPTLGTAIAPLRTIDRWHLGDAELTAKLTLFDSFALRGESRFAPRGVNVRVSVSGGYRFPTGAAGSPDVILDVPQSGHTSALLAGGYVDVLLGRHLWSSFVAHYTRPRASDVTIRAGAPGVVIAAASQRVIASRTLGDIVELTATPRWVINDFFSFGGTYSYTRRGDDVYSAVAAPPSDGSVIALVAPPDVSSLGAGTMVQVHRVGGGLVFSNAHAVSLGRSHVPFDVAYQHLETIRVSAGTAPKYTTDQIVVRLYYGRGRAAAASR